MGVCFRGPIGRSYFVYFNPWYMNKILPRVFPSIAKNMTPNKYAIISSIIDMYFS